MGALCGHPHYASLAATGGLVGDGVAYARARLQVHLDYQLVTLAWWFLPAWQGHS